MRAVTDHTEHCWPWFSKCVLQTSRISTSQNLLEMQITVLHPRFLSQETTGVAQRSDLCFSKTPDISDSVAAQFRDPGLEAMFGFYSELNGEPLKCFKHRT